MEAKHPRITIGTAERGQYPAGRKCLWTIVVSIKDITEMLSLCSKVTALPIESTGHRDLYTPNSLQPH
jgi:hypothetical protein